MTRIIAAAAVVLLAAGLLYSAMQIRDLSTEVKELRARVQRSDTPAATRVETSPTIAMLPSSPSDSDEELKRQVEALTGELAALKVALGVPANAPEGTLVASVGGTFVGAPSTPAAGADAATAAVLLAHMTPEQQEQFKSAVLKVITDQKREEEQKQRLQMTSKVLGDMKKALGLNDIQIDRVKQSLDQGTGKINELRKGMTDANAGKVKKDIQGVWTSMDQGVRQLLTVDQVSLYDNWRGTQVAKQYFGPPPRPVTAPPPPKRK